MYDSTSSARRPSSCHQAVDDPSESGALRRVLAQVERRLPPLYGARVSTAR